MSRHITNNNSHPTRSADHLSISIKKAARLKASPSPSPSRLSPGFGSKSRLSHHRSWQQHSSRGTASPRLSVFSDDEATQTSADDDADDASLSYTHLPGIKLPIPSHSMQTPKHPRNHAHKKTPSKSSVKKERIRRERKATVRKQNFDEFESDSDLTDIPSSDDDVPARRVDKGKARSSDLSMSDSDTEMEKKLLEAGDGESLLGSEGEENQQDEERFIIDDAMKREERAHVKARKDAMGGDDARNGQDWSSQGDTEHRARSSTIRRASMVQHDGVASAGDDADAEAETEAEADAEDDEEDDERNADLLSLSPDTMRIYGLPFIEDEIFEEQEGFHTSSEPSFTDFFETSTDSETAAGEGPRDDDDEFTTDSDTDEDISDLEGGVLEAPLIAHIGTAQEYGAQQESAGIEAAAQPDVPLLVIEDLDGRLIYARAGDGEAVFGSDGEFEFVDDTEDEDTDYEYDEHGNRAWRDWQSAGMLGPPEDEGDTTDELPDEDMPYPRLLVGSVAPRGGRNSRRARALAAKSRMLSPASGLQSGLPSPSVKDGTDLLVLPAPPTESGSSVQGAVATTSSVGSASASPDATQQQALEVDLTILTDDLARDPEGTLKAAAEALGLTLEEAANLVAGVRLPPSIFGGKEATAIASAPQQQGANRSLAVPAQATQTPDVPRSAKFVKPEMGSFMPTSSKSVHRAVIDGSKKAPSPFSGKRSLQKKGLAKKRTAARRSDVGDQLNKRQRRYSTTGDTTSAMEEFSEVAVSSPEPEPVDPMDLDDVVNANMLWRGNSSKSPSPEPFEGSATETEEQGDAAANKGVVLRQNKTAGRPGLNFNAFARWDKIPMGTFRDSQQASSAFNQTQHQQPLGTFLLTRSQGRSHRRQEHSPFRTSSAAAGDLGIFSMTPVRAPQDSIDGGATGAGQGGGRRRSFVISPVLFPTRSGDVANANGKNSVSSHGAFSLERHTSLPQGHFGAGGVSVQPTSNTSAGPGRITRREKRERKARRAALLAAAAETDDVKSTVSVRSEPSHSPQPDTPHLVDVSLESVKDRSDSPATALPRMRITDATPTPRASPAPAATYASVAGRAAAGGGSDADASRGLAPPGGDHDVSQGVQPFANGHEDPVETRASLVAGLPSSACKTPLHSPLFGGIFGNMVDDLEEREGETLTI